MMTISGQPTKRQAKQGRKAEAARRAIDRPPPIQGWHSSDADEIERRRWRGRAEVASVETIEAIDGPFGTYRVCSSSGSTYEVEIRALDERLNACGCADHRVNGLGTCKHIEGVLAKLRARGVRAFIAAERRGSPRIEIFLPRCDDAKPRIAWPKDAEAAAAGRSALSTFLSADGSLRDTSPQAVEALVHAVGALDEPLRCRIRISHTLAPWIAEAKRRAARSAARAQFLAEVASGAQTLEVLRHPLLPYQREGMLHLAFGERALLADEMGLGKTVQAIAASELLRRLRGIARVLVVCPASLKGEWEDQIARFSGEAARLVIGGREKRLFAYAQPAFFTVVNYEQVVGDAADINRIVAPDVVILDEAQRIKNWHTKTAAAVKSLHAPYAFVLTGTPLENRIDELYSIVQYLDPELLGPLFKFNRDFYALDERGRPVDYKNLDELSRRLAPIMLRRRKRDVEAELPGRTVTNYMVPMAEEQALRYDDFKASAARLVQIAQRRPLSPQEFEKLQRLLACMRMICDTPFILDPTCRVSPKLEELERVLADVLAEPERKVIVFSEWERMLMLVRDLAQEMGIEHAWHTGAVPQQRRRAEIDRFKRDPGCRLLLSTDSGSVGLNLQVASAVINLDLPWNPARIEQRIARAWRKNQRRQVDVINLVTENSIEHNILHLLAQKQAVADGVLDGDADLRTLRMPSGRRALVERMTAMIDGSAAAPAAAPERPPATADAVLCSALSARHGEALLLVEAHHGADGRERFLAVVDGATEAAGSDATARVVSASRAAHVEIVDRATYEALQRLAASGLIRPADEGSREVMRSPRLAAPADEAKRQRIARGTGLLGDAERKLRMALLLAQGGFAAEAVPVLSECLALATGAKVLMTEPAANADDAGQATLPPEPPETSAHRAVTADASAQPGLAAVTSSIERMLAEVRHSIGAVAQAA